MKNKSLFNDFAREPVPENKSVSWVEISLILIGVSIAVPAFLFGAFLGNSLGFANTFLASIAGSIILTAIAILTGFVGAKTRLSTYMITQFSFGKRGANIVSFVIALTLFGWFGVNLSAFSLALHSLLTSLGFVIPQMIITIIGGLLMMTTAVIGFRALDKLSIVVVPLLLVLLVYLLQATLQDTSLASVLAFSAQTPMPLGVGISLVAGALMVGAVVLPDLTRYARSTKDSFKGAIVGFTIGFPLILLLTALLAIAAGKGDFVEIMLSVQFSFVAVFILIFSAWTTNDNNLYSTSLSLSTIATKTQKWKLAIAAGIVGTLFALGGILDQFEQYLILLGIVIPPIAGIYLSDYFILKNTFGFENLKESKNFEISALIAWILGSLVGFLTTPSSSGISVFTLTTIPALDSLLSSLVMYVVLKKLI